MSDYTPSGNPVDGTTGDATEIRNEFALIQTAIATKHDSSDVGSTVQAWSANLDEYAAVNPTAAGLALLDDADASAQRTTLGLGALATVTPGTGVATALAVAVGTNGAPVILGGTLGTPSSGVATNLTGTAAGLTAGNVTTNANLTGHITSSGNAAVLGSFTVAQLSAALSDADISGTNTGDNAANSLYSGLVSNATHTGDVTGATALTIANDAVTYAKMQNVSATDKLLGRSTAGSGDVEEIPCTAAGRALLDDADATAQRATLGLGALATVTPGAGVATALAVAVGSAGAPVVNGGALGTPSSGVATNLTGTAASLTSGITNALKSATTTVNVSSATAPSSGQVLTATSGTAATWQTPSVAAMSLPRSYLAGYGLSNNGTDATNDIDIAVGTCRDSTNAYDITLTAALTKRLDAAWAVGTNQGGLDTGAITNGTYHIWVIRRSDTGVVDVLFSASATAPTMPANYDAKRRIGSILRESAAIVAFKQTGDRFRRAVPVTDVNATSTGTAAVTRTLASVPTGIVLQADVVAYLDNGSTAGRLACLITALDETDTVPTTSLFTLLAGNNAASRISQSTCLLVKTNTSAQIRTRCDSSGGSDLLIINTIGWLDTRGRDD